MKLQFISYHSSHQEALLAIFRANTPAYFSPEEEKDFVDYLEHEIELYYVIEINQTIIGCGGVNFSNDKTVGIISWGMLHPDFHNNGIGTQFLQFRLSKLKEIASVQKIIVHTSQLVYPFYEKNGFVLKEIKKDFWAPGFDLYDMDYLLKSIKY